MAGSDRRKIRNAAGRRVADRRAVAGPVAALPLPRRARRHADRIAFVQRLEPSARQHEDVDTNRLIARLQAGEDGAAEEIYLRYFDRVYGYTRAILRDQHEAEDVTQQVFFETLRGLPRFEIRAGQPFRAWLFWLARNRVLDALRRRSRLDVESPAHIQTRREIRPEAEERSGVEWISDGEIAAQVERLPARQRQVLVLRYLIGMTTEEIAVALGSSSTAVRVLQHRALRTLERQIAPASAAREAGRIPMLVRIRPASVARGRRFALAGFGLAPTQRLAASRWRRR
jgi:RNA polymerase sigma-70 factor (ECF subfamily)